MGVMVCQGGRPMTQSLQHDVYLCAKGVGLKTASGSSVLQAEVLFGWNLRMHIRRIVAQIECDKESLQQTHIQPAMNLNPLACDTLGLFQ